MLHLVTPVSKIDIDRFAITCLSIYLLGCSLWGGGGGGGGEGEGIPIILCQGNHILMLAR